MRCRLTIFVVATLCIIFTVHAWNRPFQPINPAPSIQQNMPSHPVPVVPQRPPYGPYQAYPPQGPHPQIGPSQGSPFQRYPPGGVGSRPMSPPRPMSPSRPGSPPRPGSPFKPRGLW